MSFIHLFEAWNVFVVVLNRKNNVCLNNLNQSCSWKQKFCHSWSTVLLNLTSLTKRKKGANPVHWGRPREERASSCSSSLNVSITGHFLLWSADCYSYSSSLLSPWTYCPVFQRSPTLRGYTFFLSTFFLLMFDMKQFHSLTMRFSQL